MQQALQRTGRAAGDAYERYSSAVYRVAYTYMKNRYDAEDALQETFLRLIRGKLRFEDERHELGWLILTCSNVCRDMLKSKARQHEALDEHTELAAPEPEDNALLAAVMALPFKYKAVVYLHYYEGWSVEEMARLLRRSPNTIKTWLSRARKALKNELGGEA